MRSDGWRQLDPRRRPASNRRRRRRLRSLPHPPKIHHLRLPRRLNTPATPYRSPEVEAASLARDLAAHASIRRRLPLLVSVGGDLWWGGVQARRRLLLSCEWSVAGWCSWT